MMMDRAKAYREAINRIASNASDTDALSASILYPVWEEGVTVNPGDRVRGKTDGKLYKVGDGQGHVTQADWPPETTTTLWVRIDAEHTGEQSDPIPYDGNMALECGKYYSQDEAVYMCTRDTGNPVYHALSELVGLYVEKA